MEVMVIMYQENFWNGKRVLVTGHTGFKGSWLTIWLDRLGAEVEGISLEPETPGTLFNELGLEKKIRNHNIGDIRIQENLNMVVKSCRPEVVFHLAAQPLVKRSYEDPVGTWSTNVIGSLNLLESLRGTEQSCAVIMVTTDKVYENNEWEYGYREIDRLGGYDPYSSSKAATELAIASWRKSFCGLGKIDNLAIASARAGNVIGGGDWAKDRIMPDVIRAIQKDVPVELRNPEATRPWQHVLEPLNGYMLLAKILTNTQGSSENEQYCGAFNFGPLSEGNRSVKELVEKSIQNWRGSWKDISDSEKVHEASQLNLQIEKAKAKLGWHPKWGFEESVERTVKWYKRVSEGMGATECCIEDIKSYEEKSLENEEHI